MTSYFFHIKFELYPTENPAAEERAPATGSSQDIWLPSDEASIFDDLPAHPRTYRSEAYNIERLDTNKRRSFGASATLDRRAVLGANQKPEIVDGGVPRAPIQNGHKTEPLPKRQTSERANGISSPSTSLQPQTTIRDWRFGRINIETVDPSLIYERSMAGEGSKAAAAAGPSAAPTLGPSFSGAGTATKAEFIEFEGKNTEVGWGIVHFYKEGEETPGLYNEDVEEEEAAGDAQDCTTLCIPAVPAYMSPSDFLGFLGERWQGDISHCRMVMTSRMSRYLVLLKFRDSKRAKQWRREYDGKIFNSMGSQACHVVFVKSITVCDCVDDLWICLICGYVGCGRYKGGHAKDHWKDTAHCFALELETQYVWDYAGDMWVHRLIRDKGDGKVVELPMRSNDTANSEGEEDDVVPRAKLQTIGLEYTHLITSQLESQRAYYEEMINKMVDKASRFSATAEKAAEQASEALEKSRHLEQKLNTLTKETIPQLERDLEREKGKAKKGENLARSLGQALQEEKRINEGLMKRIEHLDGEAVTMRKQMEELKTENADLKEMNRDLTMFISGQEKLKEMENEGKIEEGELEGGTMSVPEAKKKTSNRRKGKR
ncbi:RING finger protein ETP1 homolog [Trichoderma asperellum]|uniref:RING finger protein ETP1 homolog n=1 Tax=Trichoderma asperellum TaxID=101201 RepID=A0A6V8QQ33_TRIAP|nr:RING finger protein ETP1 homolog [Trichoderma asperellum]